MPVAPPVVAEPPPRYVMYEEEQEDEDMVDGPTLFSLTGNPYGRCVEMVIAHKGLNIKVHTISPTSSLGASPAYKSMNPRGKVPVLIDFRGG